MAQVNLCFVGSFVVSLVIDSGVQRFGKHFGSFVIIR